MPHYSVRSVLHPKQNWLTVVGDLVVADVQVRDGGVSYEPGHEHSHQIVVYEVALPRTRRRHTHVRPKIADVDGEGEGKGQEDGEAKRMGRPRGEVLFFNICL